MSCTSYLLWWRGSGVSLFRSASSPTARGRTDIAEAARRVMDPATAFAARANATEDCRYRQSLAPDGTGALTQILRSCFCVEGFVSDYVIRAQEATRDSG